MLRASAVTPLLAQLNTSGVRCSMCVGGGSLCELRAHSIMPTRLPRRAGCWLPTAEFSQPPAPSPAGKVTPGSPPLLATPFASTATRLRRTRRWSCSCLSWRCAAAPRRSTREASCHARAPLQEGKIAMTAIDSRFLLLCYGDRTAEIGAMRLKVRGCRAAPSRWHARHTPPCLPARTNAARCCQTRPGGAAGGCRFARWWPRGRCRRRRRGCGRGC